MKVKQLKPFIRLGAAVLLLAACTPADADKVYQAGRDFREGAQTLVQTAQSLEGSVSALRNVLVGEGDGLSGNEYQGRVESVSDGDTVRVRDGHGRKRRIRLAYIDAPELKQAHGIAARDALRAQVLGRQVAVTVFDTDQYGREVARISRNGEDINLSLLAAGHAWHYVSIAKRSQNKAAYADYAAAEAAAKRARQGLWQRRNPQAPWQFRREQRANQL